MTKFGAKPVGRGLKPLRNEKLIPVVITECGDIVDAAPGKHIEVPAYDPIHETVAFHRLPEAFSVSDVSLSELGKDFVGYGEMRVMEVTATFPSDVNAGRSNIRVAYPPATKWREQVALAEDVSGDKLQIPWGTARLEDGLAETIEWFTTANPGGYQRWYVHFARRHRRKGTVLPDVAVVRSAIFGQLADAEFPLATGGIYSGFKNAALWFDFITGCASAVTPAVTARMLMPGTEEFDRYLHAMEPYYRTSPLDYYKSVRSQAAEVISKGGACPRVF